MANRPFKLDARDLRVVIVRDGDQWFAQGIDADYAAAGTTLEDAKRRFTKGFVKSMLVNVAEHGTYDDFLTYPPQHEIEKLFEKMTSDGFGNLYTIETEPTSTFDLSLPFNRVQYFVPLN